MSIIFQDCAGVILYTAEAATQMALQAIQILGWLFDRIMINKNSAFYHLFSNHILKEDVVCWCFDLTKPYS